MVKSSKPLQICLNDSFPTLQLGLSRVSLKLVIKQIHRKIRKLTSLPGSLKLEDKARVRTGSVLLGTKISPRG